MLGRPSKCREMRVSHSSLLGMQLASVSNTVSLVAAFIPNVADSFLIETLQLVSGMNVLRSDGYSAVRRVRMPSVVADESEFTTITSKSGWSCAIIAGMDSSRYAEFELFANTITDIGAGWLPLAAEHFFNCLFNADLRRSM